mmetsp:Transcript_30539/g.74381  ORF Transcript_30539/g.74381 Transcript_30539/m.74381 type:complete len:1391 (+) Transcript_30539:190-4362(+)
MTNNVRVLARFRPASKKIGHRKEAKGDRKSKRRQSVSVSREEINDEAKLNFSDDSKSVVVNGGGVRNRRFNFDYVFPPNSTQEQLFINVAKATVDDILAGYNGTIFAYGQTGSGKTYTMFGETKNKGIIPRCAEALFEGIANTKVDVEEVFIKCSFVEIYQENVRDLLNSGGPKLKIREKPDGSTYLQGATEEYCNSPDDIYKIIQTGNKHRAVSKTDMNNQSSRSHSVLIISLTQRLSNGTQLNGGLNLADLAGSERVDRTNVTGLGLEEAKKINQSLSALGNCIKALTSKSAKHIPFRDSQLTRLLQDALGGNSKTVLVVCCSPDGSDVFETLSTLRFAERAKRVKNSAKVNAVMSVEEYQKLVKSLRQQLSQKDETISKLQKALETGGQLSPDMLESLRGNFSRPVSSYESTAEIGVIQYGHRRSIVGQLNMEDADVPGGGADSEIQSVAATDTNSRISLDESDFIQEASEVLKGLQEDLHAGSSGEKSSPAFIRQMTARYLDGGSSIATDPSQIDSPEFQTTGSFAFSDGATDDLTVESAEEMLKSFGALGGVEFDDVDGKWTQTPVQTPAPSTKTESKTSQQGESETQQQPNQESAPAPEPQLSKEEIHQKVIQALKGGNESAFRELAVKVDISEYIEYMHEAVIGGCEAIVQELLQNKAVVDLPDKNKRTPIMTAVDEHNRSMVEFLIGAKANLDIQDIEEKTALMHSALGGTERITELLVRAKANVDLKDKEGHTAAEISRMRASRMLSLLQGPRGADQMAKNLEEKEMPPEEVKEAIDIIKKAAEDGDADAIVSLAMCHMKGRGLDRDPEKAFALLNDERLKKNPKALTAVGRCYQFGIGVAKDQKSAIQKYQIAADLDYSDARVELAWCFARGDGIPREPELAFQIFSELASGRHSGAMCGLGYCYQKGLGVDVDEKVAISKYEESAAKNYPSAYTHLGKCFMATKNYNKALKLFEKASALGDRRGKYYLARCLHDGRGTERAPKKAVELYQEAAVLGDTEALIKLGRCYMKGDGIKQDPEKAVNLYVRATELDSTGGMISLGECYERATGVARDFVKSASLYQQAADKGDARAILKLGECFENARGVKISASKAFELYTRAQQAGLNEGTTRLAWCYANGVGVEEKDGKKAFMMFTAAMEKGSKEALRGLGTCYEKGLGVKSDLRKAVQMYQKAAEAGNATAWSDLANCVVAASGMSRNNQKAFLLFKKSASMGDAVGNRKLGWCYVKGIGVEKNVKKGVGYYHRAADMGDSMAISSLGVCYAKGMGVRKDQKKAFELFKRAAEMGNPTDICNLGVCYKKGTGVVVNHAKAAELFQKAADKGDAAAICNLGVCYYNGTGVRKDVDKALSFWHEAAKMGNSAAKHNLERCKTSVIRFTHNA